MMRGVVLTCIVLLLLPETLVTGAEETTPFTEFTFASTWAYTGEPTDKAVKNKKDEDEGPTEVTEYTFTYEPVTQNKADKKKGKNKGGDGDGEDSKKEKKKDKTGGGGKKEKKELTPEEKAAKKEKAAARKAKKAAEAAAGKARGKGKKKGKGKKEEATEASAGGGGGRGRGRGRRRGKGKGGGGGGDGEVTEPFTGEGLVTGEYMTSSGTVAPIITTPAPCSAGDYMTDHGCQQCGENSFSGVGAFSCTSCPEGKVAAAGSASEDDCEYAPCSAGDFMTDSGCQQCGENSYSGDEVSSCTSCPEGKVAAAGSASEDDCEYAPCSAGDFMTDSGCQQCGENSYSGDGASSCTSCPEDKVAAAGSASEDDCEYAPCSAGDFMTDSGCQQCGENSYSGDGASSCTSCPEGLVSEAGSASEDDCGHVQYPTCDCWTPECGYCSNMDCTVKQDLINSHKGVQVRSHIRRKKFNTIVLFDGDGQQIGRLQWSLSGIYLTGCGACQTPPALKKARNRGGQTAWTLSLKDGVLQIKIKGKVLYEKELTGECGAMYAEAKRFAFSKMGCDSTFSLVPDEMEAGKRMTSDCGGSC